MFQAFSDHTTRANVDIKKHTYFWLMLEHTKHMFSQKPVVPNWLILEEANRN